MQFIKSNIKTKLNKFRVEPSNRTCGSGVELSEFCPLHNPYTCQQRVDFMFSDSLLFFFCKTKNLSSYQTCSLNNADFQHLPEHMIDASLAVKGKRLSILLRGFET